MVGLCIVVDCPAYCYWFAVCTVVGWWRLLLLVGMGIVFWPILFLLVGCVYCCCLTVCNNYCLAVCIFVGWLCELLLFGCVN